ncbi:glycosyl hydrolase [Paenibacillus sp. 2TAB23]|uniref:glycosyl hydrolase n=1 Tax=Paenibacillus sp. 2TAB23 TaxID=3233004 RepID=UPI003F970F57
MNIKDGVWNWGKLRDPDSSYRSVPLWSWNDKLEIAEMERQIEEMNRVGIGGFFMHARGGLQTPYMGEEWMNAVRACIEKAESLGMEPWFYDENGWPSGFGGGSVPALGLVYQQKKLGMEKAPFRGEDRSRDLGYYVLGGTGWVRLPEGRAEEADIRIYWEVNPYYIDTLSRQAVRAFIDSTYEAYWNSFGESFKHVLKGVFTDEPQFGRGEIPWSFEMEDAYRQRNDRSVLDILPSLFLDASDAKEHRYQYWSCVTELFVDSYAKQIGDWCEEKGWSLAGHVVDEQTLMGQATSVGDLMSFYEYMQIPGCDWLGRFVGDEPLVPKQVGSVARQLGKKRTITESYGCSGWNVSMQDLKRIGEWQFVHGINMMCQHLQSYSLRGLRKRDYPPSLFYQQPWWTDYKQYNDFFARLSMLLSEGERQASILLLHPIRSAWVEQKGFDSSAIVPYHEGFAGLSRLLCRSLLEHDYGSESILERHGRVEDGMLIVGEAVYSSVIMPPSVTWSRSTVELLVELAEQGGSVFVFDPYPTLVEGKKDALLEQLLALAIKVCANHPAITDEISRAAAPFVRMKTPSGELIADDRMNVQTLKLGDSWLYYIVNSGETSYGEVEIELRREGLATLLNLETGKEEMLLQEQGVGFARLVLPIAASQSYMLKQVSLPISDTGRKEETKVMAAEAALQTDVTLTESWQVKHADLNSVTLDTCRLSIEGREWSESMPVIYLQEKLLQLGRPVRIACEFQFFVAFDTDLERQLYLVMERPDKASITLNGIAISNKDCGWWLDTAFRKLNLSGKLLAGENKLVIESEFYNAPETYEAMERAKTFESEGNKLTYDTELESVYLLGEFGVKSLTPFVDGVGRTVLAEGPFTLTESPEILDGGDLVRQGFPFFAGRLTIEQTVYVGEGLLDSEAVWSFNSQPDAVVTKLRVNSHEVKSFLWEPYVTDIGAFLVAGNNRIELELAGSCRNLLGPHHHIKLEPLKIGPDSFTNKVGWTDRDLPPETQVYQERYAFVKFGLSAAPKMTMTARR